MNKIIPISLMLMLGAGAWAPNPALAKNQFSSNGKASFGAKSKMKTADNDDNGNGKEPCVYAFGRNLIAPGFLANFGTNPVVLVCRSLPPGIAKKLVGDQKPPKDLTPPVISTVGVSSINASSVKVTWTTDEKASGRVYYGLSATASLDQMQVARDRERTRNHSVTMNGLSANSTYYFVVESEDKAGNFIRSSQQLFTTLAKTDLIGPVVSNVTVSQVTASGATISWDTNEQATAKLYYSTVSPVNLATAASVGSDVMSTSRSITFTGLSANTKYYFVVESKDASDNLGRAAEMSFTTSNQ